MKQLSVSMMCSHLSEIQKTINIFQKERIDYLHVDIMDGDFVPNFGLGVDYIRGLRSLSDIPLDMHLMIKNPEYKLKWIGIRETDIVSIHYESTPQIQRALDWLKEYKCKRFLAINPATPVFMLEEVLDHIDGINLLMVNPGFAGQRMVPNAIKKIERLKAFLKKNRAERVLIEVDGNITHEKGELLSKLGANIFVVGSSSIFKGKIEDYSQNIQSFRKRINCCID